MNARIPIFINRKHVIFRFISRSDACAAYMYKESTRLHVQLDKKCTETICTYGLLELQRLIDVIEKIIIDYYCPNWLPYFPIDKP